MNRLCRWRIDRTVARIAVAGLVNVLALVFVAGWMVGAYAIPPEPPTAAAPVAVALRKEPPPAAPAPPPEPVRPVERPARVERPPRPSPLWAPSAWRAPAWTAPVPTASPGSYAYLIREAALRHSLSPALVEAMARVESRFNPRAVSPKGARGLLQVMPATGRRFGIRPEQLFDPEHNLAAGTAYLAWLLDRYDGDLDLALAAYNAGEGAVDDHGGIPPYRETQDYVRRVRAALGRFESAEPTEDRPPSSEEALGLGSERSGEDDVEVKGEGSPDA